MTAATVESGTVVLGMDEDPAVRLAFTGRSHGNVSLVVGSGDTRGNRARLPGLVGLDPNAGVFMEQAHGCGVATVGRSESGRGLARHDEAIPAVDALVTHDTDVALVVMVADCVPVVLVDPRQGVGVVHAGRAGVAAGVIAAAVAALTDVPGRVVGILGPSIAGCCYEVPEELVEQVSRMAPMARARTRWGTPSVDLPAAAAEQLALAGVGTVRQAGGCTRCHADRWFSHRGDAPPRRGRQAGVVCRLSASVAAAGAPAGGGSAALPSTSRLPRREPGVA